MARLSAGIFSLSGNLHAGGVRTEFAAVSTREQAGIVDSVSGQAAALKKLWLLADSQLRGAKRKPETRRIIYYEHRGRGGDLYRVPLLATNSLRFKFCGERLMTDLIKALRERREELRNELQEHPSFQEYELVCRLLERREASVAVPFV